MNMQFRKHMPLGISAVILVGLSYGIWLVLSPYESVQDTVIANARGAVWDYLRRGRAEDHRGMSDSDSAKWVAVSPARIDHFGSGWRVVIRRTIGHVGATVLLDMNARPYRLTVDSTDAQR